jgi:hypothetical protein
MHQNMLKQIVQIIIVFDKTKDFVHTAGLCTNRYQFTTPNTFRDSTVFKTSSPVRFHPTNVFHREH